MLVGWTSLVFAICCQAPGKLERPEAIAAQGASDAVKELKEKVAKSAAAKSYAFELKTEREMSGGGGAAGGAGNGGGAGGTSGGGAGNGGGSGNGGAGSGAGGRGGRGGGRGFPNDTTPTVGKYAENQPVELKHGELVAYRQGEKLVYLKNGAWELESNDRGGGGASGGGDAGGGNRGGGGHSGGGAAGGGAAGGGGGRRGGGGGSERFALMGLTYVRLPHELLAGVDAKLTDVKASDETGKRVFTGNLTKEAADELSGAKRMREMGGQRGGGGAGGGAGGGGDAAAPTGTMKIVVAKDGTVETVLIETKSSSSFGNFTSKQTYTLKDFDVTKVEAPKEAVAKLSGAGSGAH